MRKSRVTDADNQVRQATWAFAAGRLEDPALLEWALDLTTEQEAERTTLRAVFDKQANLLREPFPLAWRCVFEHWQRPDAQKNHNSFLLRRGLRLGETQREMVRLIVESVRPWLKVDSSKQFRMLSREKLPRKPKHLKHLVWASISSGDRLTPQDIGLQDIEDRNFLIELATALNAALLSGLNLAKMIGSISGGSDITNSQVRRVYYVPAAQYPEGGGEPDRHSDGFAPVTKLMFTATERLARIDPEAARRIVASWDTSGWKLYRRLWAAAARNLELASAEDVLDFLETLDDGEFWWASAYPEIAELRAVRWNSLPPNGACSLERRLLKGEPAKLVPNFIEKADVPGYKKLHTFNELRRIQAAGGILSQKSVAWLEATTENIESATDVSVTHGFNQGGRLLRVSRTVTQTFDGVANHRLLDELAESLGDRGWDDNSQNAAEFVGQNARVILDLLEEHPNDVVSHRIWQAFGYSFRPVDLNKSKNDAIEADKAKIPLAVRACKMIAAERLQVLGKAIDGLVSFMGNWDRLLAGEDVYHIAWLTLWPIAVETTNETENSTSPLSDEADASPVGQLLYALINTCPRTPSDENSIWPNILSAIAETTGEARVIAQFVLVKYLGYFYATAPDWTEEHLLAPLKEAVQSTKSLKLWEGFGSGLLPQREVMAELAEPIIAAAIRSEISGDVRGDLAERVIWSILLDCKNSSAPAVPMALAQQMLRMGDDNVRKESVRALNEFLKRDEGLPEKARFELVKSVFQDVWPKERTLSSRATSEVLAELPAAAGAYYAEATELVLPYLTSFDCWSLWEYGLFDHNDPDEKFRLIDTFAKASAFLSILDTTVGGEEGAVIPMDLEDALLHIARLAPKLEKNIKFQRLLTLSRRR